MILYGEKGQIQNEKIKINILKDGTLDIGNSFWAAADQIKFKGSEQYLLLPENENDLKIIDIMSDMTDSFESSGYHFKTGTSCRISKFRAYSCTNPYIKIEIKTGKVYLMITIRNSSTVLIEDYEKT